MTSDSKEPTDGAAGPIVRFYLGVSPDASGRYIHAIQAWDHQRLEDVHNYIQWLFPTTQSSNYQVQAPVLDDAQIEAFRSDKRLQVELLHSLQLMLGFYGFMIAQAQPAVTIVRAHMGGAQTSMAPAR